MALKRESCDGQKMFIRKVYHCDYPYFIIAVYTVYCKLIYRYGKESYIPVIKITQCNTVL